MTDENAILCDLFISSLVLRRQSLVLGLVRARLPAFAELLRYLPDRHVRMRSLHLWTLIVTEAEESRPTQARSSTKMPRISCSLVTLAINRSQVQILLEATLRNNLGQVVHTYVPLSPSSITW